jgi:7-cyano-7-deazaguanine reductase
LTQDEKGNEMATEILEHSGLVVEETSLEAMNLPGLDTFEYKYRGNKINISFTCPEFTAICPFSDFPDFATIKIDYVPDELCVELKSLKLYINAFRSVKIFHEHVVNRILEDFVRACDPLSVEIEGDFNVRGNIKTVIRASYRRDETRM